MKQISIGNPLDPGTVMGPLVDRAAMETMQTALQDLRREGGTILYGGEILDEGDM